MLVLSILIAVVSTSVPSTSGEEVCLHDAIEIAKIEISAKMYCFIFSNFRVYFFVYIISNLVFLFRYLHIESAIDIAQGDFVLYLAFIPIDSINPTAALSKLLD